MIPMPSSNEYDYSQNVTNYLRENQCRLPLEMLASKVLLEVG